MKKVLVMMSTYNGEKFIREQLDSLYGQKDVELHLLVRDDGSKDNTIDILEEYSKEYGKMTVVKGKNVGAARSFHEVALYAATRMEPFDYYSYSDQDDVWFEHKLCTSIRHVESASKQPQLFYAPALLVDSKLNPIKPNNSRTVNCLGANIASSHSLGCTQVFNKALLDKIVEINDYIKTVDSKTYIPLHDAWTALVAYSFGKVEVGEAPLMFYRQHESNVIGGNDRGVKKFYHRIKRYTSGDKKKSAKCRIILTLMRDEIPTKNRKLLERCANYTESFAKRFCLAFTPDIYHYGLADNMGIFIVILLKQF